MPHVRAGRRAQTPTCRPQAGYTYLVLLLVVALMGAALGATGVLWHTAQTRDKEIELLYIGNEYRRAIQLYHANTPGPVKQYPREFEQLLKDPRLPVVRRYLRKLYRDPITGKREWGVIKAPDGGIAGVHSLSESAPYKTANFKKTDAEFEGKTKYSEWRFAYLPVTREAPAPQTLQPARPQADTRKP